MKNFILCLIFILSSLACNRIKCDKTFKESNNSLKANKILSSKLRAVYLESDSFNDEYGKITVIDLETKEINIVMNDDYYNANTIWSKDGKYIIFASSRLGDFERLRIQKYHAQKQLYRIALDNLELQKLNHSSEVKNFTGLTLNSEKNELYFSDNDNSLYSLSLQEDTLKILRQFQDIDLIKNISISDDNKYIVVQYSKFQPLKFGLYILDCEKLNTVFHYETKKIVIFLGWSSPDKIYVSDGKDNREIDFMNKKIKEIRFYNNNQYRLRQIETIDENNLLLLIEIWRIHPVSKREYIEAINIAHYNKLTASINWITDDTKIKSNLSLLKN